MHTLISQSRAPASANRLYTASAQWLWCRICTTHWKGFSKGC